MQQHPNHVDIAAAVASLADQVEALRQEMQPVCDAYKAATIGARVLKWIVTVLAGLAAVYGAYLATPK